MASFYLSSFLLLLCILHGVHGADIISDTCKKAAGPNLKYEFCVAALQTDPQSHNADLQGLGVISMKLSQAKATQITSHIQNLLSDGKENPDQISILKTCLDAYSDATPNINDAIKLLGSKDYFGANSKMSAASDAPTTCEDSFKEKRLVSPMTQENDNFFHLTIIGLAITNMFH